MSDKEISTDVKNKKAFRIKMVSIISLVTIIVAYIIIRGNYLEV